MQAVAANDLYCFQTPAPPILSPDGKRAILSLSQPRPDGLSYEKRTYLWDSVSNDIHELADCSLLRWYDKERCLFISSEGIRTALYLHSPLSGTREKLFSVSLAFTDAIPVKPGLWVLAASHSLAAEAACSCGDQSAAPRHYRIIDELPFRLDGVGYVNGIRQSLYLYDQRADQITQLLDPSFHVTQYILADCGTQIVLCGYKASRFRTSAAGLYRLDLHSRKLETLIPEGQEIILSISEEGGRIQYCARPFLPAKKTEGRKVASICAYSLPLSGGTPAFVAELPPDTTSIKIRGDDIYAMVDFENRKAIFHITPQNEARLLTEADYHVLGFDVRNGRILFHAAETAALPELYLMENKTIRRLTSIHEAYSHSHDISAPEPVRFINRDGIRIDGFVLRPRGYVPGSKYPGILDIHGGPRLLYGTEFNHSMQMLASAGCFVVYCNPRGSSGRGTEFASLGFEQFGTYDYRDLMEFVDHVLELYPDIDDQRLGVCGGSYGGYMTAWIVSQTNRFQAAVVQRPITNLCGFLNMTDQGAVPYAAQTDYGRLWEQSPIAHAQKVVTPTLIIQGEEDYRTPACEGISFFQALLRAGAEAEARLLLIKGEGHTLNRNGLPVNRVAVLEHTKQWLEQHIPGGFHAQPQPALRQNS